MSLFKKKKINKIYTLISTKLSKNTGKLVILDSLDYANSEFIFVIVLANQNFMLCAWLGATWSSVYFIGLQNSAVTQKMMLY